MPLSFRERGNHSIDLRVTLQETTEDWPTHAVFSEINPRNTTVANLFKHSTIGAVHNTFTAKVTLAMFPDPSIATAVTNLDPLGKKLPVGML